jgi:mannose/fructose/N-acetylgalactosamine-specific phosphotransferase system component IIC
VEELVGQPLVDRLEMPALGTCEFANGVVPPDEEVVAILGAIAIAVRGATSLSDAALLQMVLGSATVVATKLLG